MMQWNESETTAHWNYNILCSFSQTNGIANLNYAGKAGEAGND